MAVACRLVIHRRHLMNSLKAVRGLSIQHPRRPERFYPLNDKLSVRASKPGTSNYVLILASTLRMATKNQQRLLGDGKLAGPKLEHGSKGPMINADPT